jgi:uncharacterized membrane protein YfcA
MKFKDLFWRVGLGLFFCAWVMAKKKCGEKEFFPKPDAWDSIGVFLLAIEITAAQSGGLGGGPIMLSILLLCFDLCVPEIPAVSNSIVFMCSAARFFIVSMHLKHPRKKGYGVIDYDVLMIILPTALMGSKVGVLLNQLIAKVLLLIGLGIISFST